MYFPHNRVMLLFPPIPLPARVFVTLYAVIELFLASQDRRKASRISRIWAG